jgi:hypothetical protein
MTDDRTANLRLFKSPTLRSAFLQAFLKFVKANAFGKDQGLEKISPLVLKALRNSKNIGTSA